MVLVSYFLLNVFCGFFSCQYNYDAPEVAPVASRTADLARGSLERRAAIFVPKIITRIGALEGFTIKTVKKREIFAFEGIPYGEAPLGKLRFRPPKPKSPWVGIREAKAPGPYCAQLNMAQIPQILGKEDCLFLNIYTPKIPAKHESELLPVIVYFHGGAFALGGSHDIGPAYLLEHDVILITVNYRLGILGFLSTLDESSPGNYGLKDQALALKWIHENIAEFGGNNSLVTLFGSSAGAASVHIHLLANKTRGYFSGGISSSGTAFNTWVIQPPGQIKHMNGKLAKLTRCPLEDTKVFVDCLRKINVYRLLARQNSLYEWYSLPAVLFGPVVEPPNPDAFLTESPKEIYKRNATAPYPWISTLAQDECEGFIMILDSFRLMRPVLKQWANMSSLILNYIYSESEERAQEITKNISMYYFGSEDPSFTDNQMVGQVWSDRYFNFPAHEALLAHSKIAPTYTAVFGYKGKPSVAGYFGLDRKKWGIPHGEDEFYYFNRSSAYATFKPTDIDYGVVKFMTSAVANFAKTREPFFKDDDGNVIRIWEPVENHHTSPSRPIRSLHISNEIKMIDERHRDKFEFWESLHLS